MYMVDLALASWNHEKDDCLSVDKMIALSSVPISSFFPRIKFVNTSENGQKYQAIKLLSLSLSLNLSYTFETKWKLNSLNCNVFFVGLSHYLFRKYRQGCNYQRKDLSFQLVDWLTFFFFFLNAWALNLGSSSRYILLISFDL